MIPKVIHYCWFGGNPLPDIAVKCINSWKKYLKDYEIVEINENNFDVSQNIYTKEAYENKKFAFVTDYVRLYVLYNNGGIYMDTDVEVIKNLDEKWIQNKYLNEQNILKRFFVFLFKHKMYFSCKIIINIMRGLRRI